MRWRRGDGKRAWTVQQVDRCLAAQAEMDDVLRIETDDLTHEAVVEAVAACELSLLPETRGAVRRWWARCMVWLRHVRPNL